MKVHVVADSKQMGASAAAFVRDTIVDVVAAKGEARIIIATGASQFNLYEALLKLEVPWDKVVVFHLDEYVGLPDDHPASFRRYLNERFFNVVKPAVKEKHLVNPTEEGIVAYNELLNAADIDLCCIGIGENGHIAFNDPGTFTDWKENCVKIVELDEACRMQQVGEGWFDSLADAPTHAATLSMGAVTRGKTICCVVPDRRKAAAVKAALTGPVSLECPASILQEHPNCVLWLDVDSASSTPRDALAAYDLEVHAGAEEASSSTGGAGGEESKAE